MVGRIATSLLQSLLLLAELFIPAPALAVGSLDPPVTVIEPGCANASVTADAVGGVDGKIYGFASLSGAECSHYIWYFEGAGASWTSVISPYRGRVLGVARDEGATYLLYTDGRHTRITKRTGGQFTAGRVVGGNAYGGDVIAADGRWWAAWLEGEIVYQAKTLGHAMLHRRVVDLSNGGYFISGPEVTRLSLAPRPGGGAVLIAECCRLYDADQLFSELRVLVSADGNWVHRFDVSGRRLFSAPQAAASGRVTWLAWLHDGQAQVMRNRTGQFAQRNFVVPAAGELRLGASQGKAFLAWETQETPTRVFLAEEVPDGTWTGTVVSPVTTRHQRLAAVAVTGGKATVLMMTATRLYARSQP